MALHIELLVSRDTYKLRKFYITEKLLKKWLLHFSVDNRFTRFVKTKVTKEK
jgi:hypothetical protein